MSVHTVLLAALATTAVLCTLGGAQAEYTADNAMTALRYVKASFCDADNIYNWNCPSCQETPSLSEVRVFENWRMSTKGYVGVSNDRIVVAFRGSKDIRNSAVSSNFLRADYIKQDCYQCGVPIGVFESYLTLRDDILRTVQEYINAHPNYSILVTGHTIGGAMAIYAAAEIAELKNPAGNTPHIDLYTFGSPRVGNQEFVNWFARLFCKGGHSSYRVVHNRDKYPHIVPHYMGYRHVSREYFYGNDGDTNWVKCSDISENDCPDKTVTEDKKCSFDFYRTKKYDHLKYLGTFVQC